MADLVCRDPEMDLPVNMSNIVLVGFMGTGKSSVGRAVAGLLGMSFVDMDDVIELRAKKKISAIFAEEGEKHFRSLERALVKELSAQTGLVIACGGGVVLNPDNISDYSRTGTVICLMADPDTILKRVSGSSHRPLLEGDEKSKKIISLLESRRALYGAIPIRIDTSTMSVADVAGEVIRLAGCKRD